MKKVVLVTGSAGLIGAETVRRFVQEGYRVAGIDNDLRAEFFGAAASTKPALARLQAACGASYTHHALDIRDRAALESLVRELSLGPAPGLALIVHTAAQPSHDWAARAPHTDFGVNALGTLNLLEAARQFCPETPFIFTSTNKVYGDTPNRLPLVEQATRWELAAEHPFFAHGVDESMSLDQSRHSLFGVSKVAADLLVQEYGSYFGLPTVCFRGGCLTGPGHAGAELHGFLAYLMQCAVRRVPYRVFGYQGKQVRDNIHCHDLVDAFWHFFQQPRASVVYNMGGGRLANCSMREAIRMCEEISGHKLEWSYVDENRHGDHIWWVSDTRRFARDYPRWQQRYDVRATLTEIAEAVRARA